MVLESIITPFKAEKKPWELFFLGLIYSSFAIALSLWVFEQYAGLLAVFLTVMACVPLIYNTLKLEESKNMIVEGERRLLKEHGKAISFLTFLFLGITISFMIWYLALPGEISADLFRIQTNTIFTLNAKAASAGLFTKILMNNLKVLTFCILFSFFYGAGAIFVLTWNASVIATAIGSFVKEQLLAQNTYLFSVSYGLLRYLVHGIPEIIAYFIAALAGGIISVAVIRHDYKTKNFQKIMFDTSNLIILSVIILVIAAFIETYFTPLLF
ncbi:stage II sporulation protein M [Nanoarchaeota archaeon]